MRKLITFLLIVAGLGIAQHYFRFPMPSFNNPKSIIGLMGGLLMVVGVIVVVEMVSDLVSSDDKTSNPLILRIFHVILVAFFIFALFYIYNAFMGNRSIPFQINVKLLGEGV